MAYDPSTFKAPTYHDATASFLAGKSSPRDYLERCLATIEAREPTVKAWVFLNKEGARTAADASSKRYKEGRPLSRIDGIPLGIKDLISTKDMPTQMGSELYRNHETHQDSASIRALRDAGAVVLGKTVTTELGMSHPGPTTNPFDPARTPGGSSSGSAAAVGAGMVPACIGTQVVGSIIRPAGFCANVALKPTFGAIHRGERLGYSQSQFGVHAGSLEDMWSVSMEMARRAGGDPGRPGLLGALHLEEPLRPTRLIVMEGEGWPEVEEPTRNAFDTLLSRLESAGIDILRRSDNPLIARFEQSIGESMALCRDICGYELRWTLENLVERHPGKLSDSLMGRLERSRTTTLDDYRDLLEQRATMQRAHAALAGLADGLISLSSVGPAPPMGDTRGSDGAITHTTGTPVMNAATSALWAPTVTIPLLAVDDMPVGVQLIGQQHGDERMTRVARWLLQRIAPVVA